MAVENPSLVRSARLKSAGIFLAISTILAAAGGWYYQMEVGLVTREKHEALHSIGQLKIRQIETWRTNHEENLLRSIQSPFFIDSLESFLSASEDPERQAVIRGFLNLELGTGESSVLYAPDGRFLIGVGEDACAEPHLASGPLQKAIAAAIGSPGVMFSDLYRCPHGDYHVDALVAVRDDQGRPLAVATLRSDAVASLYPLIGAWPNQSASAEALLVQREGDDVVILNPLRNSAEEPLTLRFPLADRRLFAVRAAQGEVGILEGDDYRGIAVVCDIQAVPGSTWFLITKIDAAEIFSEVRYRTAIIGIVTGLLILMAAGYVALTHRRRQARLARQLEASEDRNVADRHRHELILQTAMDGFWLINEAGRIIEVNEAYCRMLGYQAKEVIGMEIADIEANEDQAQTNARIQRIIQQGEDRFESRHRRKDGSLVDVEVSVQHRPADGFCVAFIRDITRRKQADARIMRLSLLYAALSRCDKAIVHSANEEELLSRVCQDVVNHGGMKMAWIGLADQVAKRVFPTAFFGTGTEYLVGLEISLDSSAAAGRGPTGTAIREGRAIFCQDFLGDPSTVPWQDRGLALGWRSSAAIPLRRGGKTIGAFTLYSGECDAFDDEVQTLLVEMADNISFALDSFAREKGRRKAIEELQTLQTAVEQSADTIVITDPAGRIEYANPAFEKSTGYLLSEVLGQNPRVLNSGEHDEAFYRELWTTISAGKTWKGLFRNRRKDGTLYWESAAISPVLNEHGETAHFIAVKDDITHLKEIETRLREALDRAEAANRAKGEFLAVMSHELRTPLNGVLGFADLLCQTPLTEDQRQYAQTIRSSGDHLLQVVNDILDFSSIEKGTMPLEAVPVALTELLEKSTTACRKAAADKGLVFRKELADGLPLRLVGDARRIRQILINLLGNAVKFTARGSVVLRVTPAVAEELPVVDFAIEDTGPGIRPEVLEQLFEPFMQGDSTLQREFEGTGLGLAISQRLANAMDGRIRVVSTPGVGSTFTLRLPVGSSAEVQAVSEVVPPPVPLEAAAVATDLPVLVVEDDPVNRLLVRIMLKSLGYRVEIAADGRDALEMFVPGRFFAILMDMQMPEMDGLEATRQIRQRETTAGGRVPIIALTANVMAGDRERCLAAGMDDFLTKPFKKSELATKLAVVTANPQSATGL
jgi:PAS domain S-box-containing protein